MTRSVRLSGGWLVGNTVFLSFYAHLMLILRHFKSFYILTFSLLVLTTARDLEVLALFANIALHEEAL